MRVHLRRTVVALVLLTALCGLAYPLLVTGLAQAIFPAQAQGSLSRFGSTEIGQPWSGPGWFHGRPDPDTPMASGGSNLGPRSQALVRQVEQALAMWRRLGVAHPPADLVTTSGSGLDPQISPAAALAQVGMVARARHLPVQKLRHLVLAHVVGPEWGFLGQATVDVLQLNRALAALAARHRAG